MKYYETNRTVLLNIFLICAHVRFPITSLLLIGAECAVFTIPVTEYNLECVLRDQVDAYDLQARRRPFVLSRGKGIRAMHYRSSATISGYTWAVARVALDKMG